MGGYVTEYSYSPLDLVSHINYNGAKEAAFAYNKAGELVRMEDWTGTNASEPQTNEFPPCLHSFNELYAILGLVLVTNFELAPALAPAFSEIG